MSRNLFIPVYRSLLSDSALAERLLPEYDLPPGATCHFWSQSINDTYLVRAGAHQWMLRIAPAQRRSNEQLATEIELLHFLHQHGLQVPQPVSLRDGAMARTLAAPEGPRHAVLFTYLPGAGYTPTTTHSYRYGQAIAHFHAVADSFPHDRPLWRFETAELLHRPLELLHAWLVSWPADRTFLAELGERLNPLLTTLPRTAPIYGLCHGDLNNGNLRLIGDDQWALLDFEYSDYGWRVFTSQPFSTPSSIRRDTLFRPGGCWTLFSMATSRSGYSPRPSEQLCQHVWRCAKSGYGASR